MIIGVLSEFNLKEKYIAFTGDNCNTNFRGINRKGKQNVFLKIKEQLAESLIEKGCPDHILNNVTYANTVLFIDLESIIFWVWNYFSIFTVRTEWLKEFCDFVEIEYRSQLKHSALRWLSLFPAVEIFLVMFSPVMSYFSSIENPSKIIKNFLNNDFNECCLWVEHSLMAMFHVHIVSLEREKTP